MKKKIIIVFILVIIILLICFIFNKPNEDNKQEAHNEIQNQVSTENISTNENTTSPENQEIEDLKQQYNMTGDSEIYNIETESDGRKVINVKPSVNFKVAFSGMIKNSQPNFQELDSIFETNAPTEKGIWIKKEDRGKILTSVNNNQNLKCEYEVNEKGYLEIKENKNATSYDKKIERIINGDKQYIFCISSICYMVDAVTGEIIDNPYNELDPYQTYEYFKDEERTIIFITENKESNMTQNEIFESIMQLINLD